MEDGESNVTEAAVVRCLNEESTKAPTKANRR